MKAYRASSRGSGVTANTPRQAALGFFALFPTKRKCDVIEGEADGHFFTGKYGRVSTGECPQSWKDVTKKQAELLPEEA